MIQATTYHVAVSIFTYVDYRRCLKHMLILQKGTQNWVVQLRFPLFMHATLISCEWRTVLSKKHNKQFSFQHPIYPVCMYSGIPLLSIAATAHEQKLGGPCSRCEARNINHTVLFFAKALRISAIFFFFFLSTSKS